MRKRCKFNRGSCALAFACGLIASCFLPPRLLIAVLAIWVIILAVGCAK